MLPRLTAERPVSNPGIIKPADRSWAEINSAAIPVPEKKAKAGKNSAHGSWNISAGLAMNAMMGEKQSLRPYPAAEIRYNISDRFYVSAGLAPGSPLAVSSRGIDKRVYLNDTSNNVNFYNNVKHYSRLTYADVPLMAGVKISKKINIQAGVQASVLMHTKTTSAIEQYDFQMVMSNGLPANLITAAPPVSEEKYKVSARKIDYRFVAGVQYDIGKASLNLNYQHASRTALKGNQVSSKRNELISLGIQFNIR